MANDIARIQLPNGVIADIRANKVPYGECSTSASTAEKVVNIGNAFILEAGSIVIVKFTTTNTALVENLTLNVNGTGAKAIKHRNNFLSSADILSENKIYNFIYDGNAWQLIGDLNSEVNIQTTSNSFIETSSFSWASGSLPTFGTSISTDDITSWNAGTLPTMTVSGSILKFSAGALPSLSYSEKTIPNVTGVGQLPTLSWSAASAITEITI